MFERFTDRGRKIIILAREEAERHQNDYLGTEHLVLAILRESDGIALMIIKKMGLSAEELLEFTPMDLKPVNRLRVICPLTVLHHL